MDPFSDSDEDRPVNLNRSCNQKIENDSIDRPSSDSFEVRLTKSEKQLDEIDEISMLEDMKKNWKTNQRHKSEYTRGIQQPIRHPLNINPGLKKNHPDFGTEILDSESVSIDEEFIAKYEGRDKAKIQESTLKVQEMRHRTTTKSTKSSYIKLNILLAGRSGIGKSSFIDSFCDKKWDQLPPIREKTECMKVHTYEQVIEHSTVDISLIDYPGFQETGIQEYIENIKKIILEGFEKRFNSSKEKKNGNGNKNGNGSSGIKNINDQRIHCCIFFISGPWISEAEWQIMKRLQQTVNIIPVIAKGDTFTAPELKHFKKKIYEKNRAENLNWFSLEEIIRQNYPEKLERLINGAFGKSPPFVITCGSEKIYDYERKTFELTRNYKWGELKLDNNEYNDFKYLKQLLTQCLGEVLIKHTDLMEKRFIELKNRDGQFLMSSNSEISPININMSQKPDASRGQGAMEERGPSKYMLTIQIGLTVLGVAAAIFIFRKNKRK